MNTNNLNRTTSISKVFKGKRIIPFVIIGATYFIYLEKQNIFTKKTAESSKTDKLPAMQADDFEAFSKNLEELPILIDLNSSTESASSASTCSSSSTNASSSYSNTSQPYQFYFGEIR